MKYINNRIFFQNKNLIGACIGETGSGKSYAMLSLAEGVSKINETDFDINKVIFEPKEFTNLIRKGEREKLKEGTVLIWDEAGVGLGSNFWYTLLNKSLGLILQTFRSKNIILLFTVPNLSFIDASARRLMHFIFEMDGINYNAGQSYVKPLRIEVNNRTGDLYYKYLIDKDNVKISSLVLDLPSPGLITDYEKKKKLFQNNMFADVDEVVKKLDRLKGIKPTQEEIKIYETYKLGKTQEEIADEYGFYRMKVTRIVNKCKLYFHDE